MASERQREANRRNGSKGGPKTDAGKQASRVNSLKHGLTSTTLVVLPDENQHEYNEILQGFRESFQPHSPAEDALVLRLAQAHWRSLRSRRLETGILSITATTEQARAHKLVDDCPEHLNAHNAIAASFLIHPVERWQAYLRYDAAISRDFFRTLDALAKLQKARRQNTGPETKALACGAGTLHNAISGPTTEVSDFGIRSVSQNTSSNQQHKQKEHIHASQEQNILRRALRSDRPVARTAQDTPRSLGAKEGNLRRLSTPARVLPRRPRRAGARNYRRLGRQREQGTPTNPSVVVTHDISRSNRRRSSIFSRIDIESFHRMHTRRLA